MNDIEKRFNAEVGKRIRDARIARGMTESDLSASSQTSLPQISRIETGKSNMFLATFARITEALQISADYLLQTDTPAVKTMQRDELDDLLSDCTQSEINAILKIAREVKATMADHKKQYEE